MLKHSCPFECPLSYSSREELNQHISQSHIDDPPAAQVPLFPKRPPIPEEEEDSENVSSSEDSTPTPIQSTSRVVRPLPSIMPRTEPSADQPLTDDLVREVAQCSDLDTITDVSPTQLSLRALRINSVQCNDALHLSALTQLQSLCLAQNKLSTIQGLSELPELRELDLSFNYIIKLR